ncbi:MAG: putative aminohydrolase SsnA [Chloroflexota bacterium]|nr:putative aminohydrolase SsnA [Chloroflexota bacterium]
MLITNATLVTWETPNRVLPDHALQIIDGVIADIGATRDLEARYPADERIDARGQIVMPGSICAHTHFYGAFARGLAIPGDPPRDFPEILSRLWWNLDKALDKDAVRLSALVCLVDAIKHGTTTLFDHHASPNFISGSLDVIADAVDHAGLRAVLCYEVTDRDGKEKANAGIEENVRFIRHSMNRARVRGTFGLHASLSLSDPTLQACKDAHPNRGFHIHVAEHEADEADSLEKYHMRVVDRLKIFDMVDDQTIVAHAVHIDERERDLLAQTGTWVTHQPRSNMNNAVGAMRLDDFLMNGLADRLCLGNDGFSNAMWDEWKAAYLLHKVVNRDPRRANGADIAHMAAVNNARLTDVFFPGKSVGRLIVGAAADIIMVDYHPFTPLTEGNLPWHILFGFESSMITTTMVDGRVLMRDRQLLTLDEAAIAAEARALAPEVWARYNEISKRTTEY